MGPLMHAYYFYSAVLAMKLLALIPLSTIATCYNKEKLQRANISDLKHLTPFWLVAGLYVTTSPEPDLAINLMRAYTAARIIAALGYVCRIPKHANEAAFFLSFAITSFMGGTVIFKYKDCL